MRGGQDLRFVGPALPIDQTNYVQMVDVYSWAISTILHYVGDAVGKVADCDLRATGIGLLHVVDGSLVGVSSGTNFRATLMMLGHYVSGNNINMHSFRI